MVFTHCERICARKWLVQGHLFCGHPNRADLFLLRVIELWDKLLLIHIETEWVVTNCEWCAEPFVHILICLFCQCRWAALTPFTCRNSWAVTERIFGKLQIQRKEIISTVHTQNWNFSPSLPSAVRRAINKTFGCDQFTHEKVRICCWISAKRNPRLCLR